MKDPNSDPLFTDNNLKHNSEGPILIAPIIVTIVTLCAVIAIFVIYFVTSNLTDQISSIIMFNDLHIDPLYEEYSNFKDGYWCRNKTSNIKFPFGQYGCDIPNKTFLSMINNMKEVLPNPEFILFGGDSIGHDLGYNLSQLQYHIKYVIDSISNKFPNIPILMIPGNNDFLPNYGTWENDNLNLPNILSTFSQFLNNNEKETFLKGGYYYRDFLKLNLRILFLNSIIYSQRRPFNSTLLDPYDQFLFIKEKSIEAKKNNLKISIFMHIPPGVSYSDYIQGFHDYYADKFFEITYNFNFSFILTGHNHIDLFMPMFLKNNEPHSYALSSPSVSSAHFNNPSYRILEISNGELIDYIQYYTDLLFNPQENLNWIKEYRFTETYLQKSVSNNSIFNAINYIKNSGEGLWKYKERIYTRADDSNSFYYCLLKCRKMSEILNCTSGLNNKFYPYSNRE